MFEMNTIIASGQALEMVCVIFVSNFDQSSKSVRFSICPRENSFGGNVKMLFMSFRTGEEFVKEEQEI